MAGVAENVSKAYNERTRDLNYHSRWVKARTAASAVREIGSYNQFKPKHVADALERIQQKDPNAMFSIGREGSPVIYVQTGKPRSAIGVLGAMDGMRAPDELDKVTGTRNAERYLSRLPKKSGGMSVVRAWWD